MLSHAASRTTSGRPVWHDQLFSTLYACPELQDQLRRNRAADVQLQQPLRRLSGVRGAGLARGVRSRVGPSRRRTFAGRRGDRAVERTFRRPCCGIEKLPPTFVRGRRNRLVDAAGDSSSRRRGSNCSAATASVSRRASCWRRSMSRPPIQRSSGSGWRRFAANVACPECNGARLRPEARACPLRRAGDPRDHGDDRRAARKFFASLIRRADQDPIAQPILRRNRQAARFSRQRSGWNTSRSTAPRTR